MPKKNINKNLNDPRAEKSIRDIKRAMLEFITAMPFEQIHVEQIIATAPVNKNTFYKYFASKQDVLDAIREDLLSEMRDKLNDENTRSMREAVLIFYQMMERPEASFQKLFSDDKYSDFKKQLTDDYFALDFFKRFSPDSSYDDIVISYIGDAAVGIYNWWKKKKPTDRIAIEELAVLTEQMLMNGLRSVEA